MARKQERLIRIIVTPNELEKLNETLGVKLRSSDMKVETSCKCDICGKEINLGDWFYSVMTGHNDWGNDSCDSIQSFDVCSDGCLEAQMALFYDTTDETKYIRVDRERYWRK